MSNPTASESVLVFTAEEFAAELGFKASFLKHLTVRKAFADEVIVIDDEYHVTAENLDIIKERNRKAGEELAYAFAHSDEIKRRLVARAAGVDEETAKSLGY